LGNGATVYYLFSPTDDCQAEIDELLLAHKVVGIAQLLTRRELDVIKEIFDLDNTSKVAAKLGISESTLVNHQSNISKKSGFRVREIASMVADCSSVELLTSVVTPTITVA
jgi:FixJ family two-component response regulator